MNDLEMDAMLKKLEATRNMSIADFDGVVYAIAFLLPQVTTPPVDHLAMTDKAILIADEAFPNWSIHIRGLANCRDGHWQCTLRENEARDNDAVIGTGRSPVLAQAILAAVIRLAMARRD
jgi:hypothetical protein